jgi:hypothetical protein
MGEKVTLGVLLPEIKSSNLLATNAMPSNDLILFDIPGFSSYQENINKSARYSFPGI